MSSKQAYLANTGYQLWSYGTPCLEVCLCSSSGKGTRTASTRLRHEVCCRGNTHTANSQLSLLNFTLLSGLSSAWSTATCITSNNRLTKTGETMMQELLRLFLFW